MDTPITIKPLTDLDSFHHFQRLEQIVWSSPDDDLVPIHVLVTVCKNGGLLIGAYADDGPDECGGMIGATFGWPGFGKDHTALERSKLCSHQLGVHPEWQGHGIGRQLKLAQRETVLKQGQTDWITWTYDPLYLPNAILNINRLGAICNTYQRNIYGIMTDALNAGTPSDRCQVDWHLQSEHVTDRLAEDYQPKSWPVDQMQILPTQLVTDEFYRPIEDALRLEGQPIAVPIPADIGAMRRQDSKLAHEWRLYMRTVLEEAFAGGYVMVDCVQLSNGHWYYVLDVSIGIHPEDIRINSKEEWLALHR